VETGPTADEIQIAGGTHLIEHTREFVTACQHVQDFAARLMHLAMLCLLVWFGLLFGFRTSGWLGIGAVGLLLAYEHSLVSPRDLRRLNAAFFTMNGVIATVFFAFVATDLWLRS